MVVSATAHPECTTARSHQSSLDTEARLFRRGRLRVIEIPDVVFARPRKVLGGDVHLAERLEKEDPCHDNQQTAEVSDDVFTGEAAPLTEKNGRRKDHAAGEDDVQ